MSSQVISTAIAFALGLFASYFVWLGVAYIHLPKIEVSEIAREPTEDDPSMYRYRIKVRNGSRRREMFDLSIQCRIVIAGRTDDQHKNKSSLRLPVSDEHPFPVLDPGEARVFTLRISQIAGGGLNRVSKEIQDLLPTRRVPLEELLKIDGKDGFVRVAVSGSHQIGGLRRSESRKYNRGNVIPGTFDPPDSVLIQRDPDQPEPVFPPPDKTPDHRRQSSG